MANKKYIDGYDAEFVASFGTYDEFKAMADEQYEANNTAWYGNHGVNRGIRLQKLYDESVVRFPEAAKEAQKLAKEQAKTAPVEEPKAKK